jgi:hypothetical protein
LAKKIPKRELDQLQIDYKGRNSRESRKNVLNPNSSHHQQAQSDMCQMNKLILKVKNEINDTKYNQLPQ